MEDLSKEYLISFIGKRIEKTHNDKDKQDLLTFSHEELIEIYNQINEQ